MSTKVDDRSIRIYLGIAFLLPFCCVLFEHYVGNNLFIFAVQGTSPTIAALIVMAMDHKLTEFLKRTVKNSFSIKICALGFCIPMLVLFISKCVMQGLHLSSGKFCSPISANKLMIIFFALIAEEFGWRGFLQNLLDEKINSVFVPIIIGACIWHFSGNLFSNLFKIESYWVCNLVYIIYLVIFIFGFLRKNQDDIF